jgi:predicted nucleic acid-binding protein
VSAGAANYLLDTNHWSPIQRRHPAVVGKLQSLPEEATLFMPVVAQAELLAGVEALPDGRRKDELRRLYEETIQEAAEILPIDSRVAEQFARIFARLRRVGRPIETNDMWLGAIALAHDLTVASSDVHLHGIEGLRVEDWTAA